MAKMSWLSYAFNGGGASERKNEKCLATVENRSRMRGSDRKREGASLDRVFVLIPDVTDIADSP